MDKEKNFVSAVVYVHNAEERIASFLQTIIQTLEGNFLNSEIICVNDALTDNSLKKIKDVSRQAKTASISVINLSRFHGLEVAMCAGNDLAIGDFVFEFDNTVLDYEPALIMDIYRRALTGYDIVSAAPDSRERLSSSLFYWVFAKFASLPGEIVTESFRVLSRRVINRVSSMNKTIPYRKVVYANSGLKTDTLYYKSQKAEKVLLDAKEKEYRQILAVDSLLLFTKVGYKFSRTMTILMMLVSVFMTVYSLATWFLAHPVVGWTTTILFLSVAFFGLFGILTIVVKYLQLLIDLVFKRKNYSFESIEKLTK